MPTPHEPREKVRLNVQLTSSVKERLEALQAETNAESVAAVLRDCIALYDTLIGFQREGSRLQLRHPDGEVETILLVPTL